MSILTLKNEILKYKNKSYKAKDVYISKYTSLTRDIILDITLNSVVGKGIVKIIKTAKTIPITLCLSRKINISKDYIICFSDGILESTMITIDEIPIKPKYLEILKNKKFRIELNEGKYGYVI